MGEFNREDNIQVVDKFASPAVGERLAYADSNGGVAIAIGFADGVFVDRMSPEDARALSHALYDAADRVDGGEGDPRF